MSNNMSDKAKAFARDLVALCAKHGAYVNAHNCGCCDDCGIAVEGCFVSKFEADAKGVTIRDEKVDLGD